MPDHREYELTPGGFALRLGRTARFMGILNVTPDSFSDGGRFDAVPADGITAPISIDTYKAEVAERAIAAGATIKRPRLA